MIYFALIAIGGLELKIDSPSPELRTEWLNQVLSHFYPGPTMPFTVKQWGEWQP